MDDDDVEEIVDDVEENIDIDGVEVIIPDPIEDAHDEGAFFSQVQIQVHGADAAESIIDTISDNPQDLEYGPAEYLDEDNDIQIISDDEDPGLEHSKTIPEDCKDTILNETKDMHFAEDHDKLNSSEIPIKEDYNYNDLIEVQNPRELEIADTNNLHESHASDDMDNVEKIPDKEISKYDAVIEEYSDFYGDISIKEEPFLGTDYTDFDPDTIEQDNKEDKLPPEDIYYFSSRIILGTKPCPSVSERHIFRDLLSKTDDENEIEKEYLDAVVPLEDWGINLVKSQSFCKDCGRLFATPNALDAHNMTVHSFLVPVSRNTAVKSTSKPAYARKSTGMIVKSVKNSARKSTGNQILGSKLCNHCDMVFPDHDALITHLYEHITLKQFNCDTCNVSFKSKNELVNHSAVHKKAEKVKVKKETIDKTDPNTKNKLVKKEVVQKKRVRSRNSDKGAIPKSILFQCPTCNVHFMSAYAASLHLAVCNPGVQRKIWCCDICNRNFFSRCQQLHKKQHTICSKFKVYKLTKNLYAKTLCKCCNCNIHFSDYCMLVHLKSCGKIDSEMCQKCNILLPKSKIPQHMRMHKQINLKPKDLIIVPYVISKNPSVQSSLKRKQEMTSPPSKKIKLDFSNIKIETPSTIRPIKIKKESIISKSMEIPKRIKKEPLCSQETRYQYTRKLKESNKVLMSFCVKCKSCSQKDIPSAHIKKKCMTSKIKHNQVICDVCGLQLNYKTVIPHKKLHETKNLTIHDMVFCQVGTLKRIAPVMPDYPQCKDCKITFFNKSLRRDHICGEDYETCNVCGEKFHLTAYDAHIEFHKLIETVKPKAKKQPKLMPELMKKYKSLNMMWNILYSCQKCEIVTDQYDNAVEHSQGHLNNQRTTKNIKCYICNLKFDEACWTKHSELHSQTKINSKDFNILGYNPRKLLTEEWFELFATLPEEQIKQITDKSSYGSERRYKVKVLKEGRPEFTLYCCSDCNVCCRNNEIEKHINGACKTPDNVCKICNIPFCDISTLKNHQILHLKGIKKEEFRVVMFTKRISSELKVVSANLKIKIKKENKRYVKVKNVIREKIEDANKIKKPDSNVKIVLYKCKKCKGCLKRKCHVSRHNCDKKSLFKCVQCNQFYITSVSTSAMLKNLHQIQHKKQPYNARNLKIITFDPQDPNINSSNTTNNGIKKPVTKKRQVVANVSKISNTPSKQAITHSKIVKSKNAEAQSASPKHEETANSSAFVYKCKCGLHYTSLKTIEKHAQNCPNTEISTENCSKCGLLFPTDVLVNHLCNHHGKTKKVIVVIEPDKPQSSDFVESTSETPQIKEITTKSNTEVTLYKCNECNVYYLNKNTCYKHVYRNHQAINPSNFIACKLCGLQFSTYTLSLHIIRHHRTELNMEDVSIVEYYPRASNGPLKIDRYIAADKIQSLQVTSSVEESTMSDSEDVVVD